MAYRVVYAALVVTGLALSGLTAFGPDSPRVTVDEAHAQATYKFTGTASCGSSKCHGNTTPRAEYPKMNENIIWTQKDKHAKAYATLINEKLKSGVSPSKIAKNLNIAKAETSDRCLVCHAVNAKPELRDKKFDITDGVHCEGCHGPAEKWLEPHAEKGWTHEKSVAVGMYDTKDLFLRAEKCVSCHLAIDADMVAAGHPDLLAFELDTFSATMSNPPHWRDKGTWFGTRAWAVGQLVSLREAARQVADRAKANASPKLLEEAIKKVTGHGAVVKSLLAVAGPEAQKSLEADLAAIVEQGKKNDRAGLTATGTKIASAMTREAQRVAKREFDQAQTQKLIQTIAGDADAVAAGGIRSAEQAAMALDRLYNTYSKAPGQKADKSLSEALDKVFASIEDPAKYNAAAFATQVKGFQKTFK